MGVQLTVVAVALALALGALALRRRLARRGSGRLAQVEFRRRHGEHVAALLDGEVDPRPHSPWIAIRVDGRPARMVAARLDGRMQAGIELYERAIPVNIYLTNGDPDELDVPRDIGEAAVLAVATRLAAADVDSLAANAPIEQADGMPHVLRMRFDTVEELPDRIRAITPLLRELEALRPEPPVS